MELDLYLTKDGNNTIGKSLTLLKKLNINLKNRDDISNMALILNRSNFPDHCNYAKISELNRYYFVTDIVQTNAKFVTVSLESDVLETNKGVILSSMATITGKSKPSYISNSLPVDSRTEQEKFESDKTLPDKSSYVIVTIGG